MKRRPSVNLDPATIRQHRLVAGFLALPLTTLLALGSAGAGIRWGSSLLLASSLLLFLLAGMLAVFRSVLSFRIRLATPASRTGAERKSTDESPVRESRSPDAEIPPVEGEPISPISISAGDSEPTSNSSEGYEAPASTTRRPLYLQMLIGLACAVTAMIGLAIIYPEPDLSQGLATTLGFVCLFSLLVPAVLIRYYAELRSMAVPEAATLARWFRAVSWCLALLSLSLLARGFWRPLADTILTRIILAAIMFLSLEIFLRAGMTARNSRSSGLPVGEMWVDPQTLRLLASSLNPLSSLFRAFEDAFGVDLRSSWAIEFVRRSIAPLALLLVVVGWLSTSLVVVGPQEQGVLERFGHPATDHPLGPGLHTVWPWPVDRVVHVPVSRVKSLSIGFKAGRPGASMLWTKPQASEEYYLLLGDGRDLVSIHAVLQYRISDIFEYLYGCRDPDSLLEVVTYRTLMWLTTDKSLDEVLSENMQSFTKQVVTEVQRVAQRNHLGLEILAFNLLGLHPPLQVAGDYQAVASAQVDRETRIIQAQAYRMETLPAAEAEAVSITNEALSEKATRYAEASGEAMAFKSIEAQFRTSPSLFKFRRRLETLDSSLKENRLYLVDDRIERDGGNLWILE